MNTFNTNEQNIRSKQKFFSMLSCLIFVLLISYASCQQANEDDAATLNDSDYTDADDIEWGNFPVAETTTKGHPIIFYKEDIVSEDYDPNKDNNKSSKEAKPQLRRRYKDINRRNRLNRTENYRYIKPEKVYFDVYPIEYDKVTEDDSKFNDDDIQVEVISLLDVPNKNDQGDETYSKQQLNKRPKKVVRHHRQRRDVARQRASRPQQKREAYFYYHPYVPFFYASKRKLKIPIKSVNVNVPVPTTPRTTRRPTGTSATTPEVSIGNRIDTDTTTEKWVVWGREPFTERPKRRRPAPPVIHTGDEDYISNSQQPGTSRPPATTTYRPPTTMTYRPMTTRRTTPRPAWEGTSSNGIAAAPQESAVLDVEPAPTGIKPCVWAVQNCCRKDAQIHYECFETLGCIGNFWDVNPCTSSFVRRALEDTNNYFMTSSRI